MRLLAPVEDLDWEEEVVLDKLLTVSTERMQRVERRDLSRLSVVAEHLLEHCTELQVSGELLASVAAADPLLLLLRPLELRARLQLLGSVLQLPSTSSVLQLTLQYPTLLCRSSSALSQRLTEMDALLKSRGLSLQSMARRQPDLLVQAPGSLRIKIDAIPAALDLPPRRARDVIARCPQLLRRSPATVADRYRVLQNLFDSVPRNYLSELVTQEPRVLCLSSATLAAKFASLTRKYGAFQDDIVDIILVDPNVFLNAPAATSATSVPKKKQRQQPADAARGGSRQSPADGVAQLLRLAAELRVPLESLLGPCAAGSEMCEWAPGTVARRIDALATALSVSADEAAALVRGAPGLLELRAETLQGRRAVLRELLPAGEGGGGGASGVSALLANHPLLLLAQPDELRARVAALAAALGMPPQRVPSLLAKCPGLIAQPPAAVAEQLGRVREIFGGASVPASLVAEMVTREPRLLSTPAAELESSFETLALSFGWSGRETAIDVCMADPSMLIRDKPGAGAGDSESDGSLMAGDAQMLEEDGGGGGGRIRARRGGRGAADTRGGGVPPALEEQGGKRSPGSSGKQQRGAKPKVGKGGGRYLEQR
ncbi:hypothetical protein FOA52_006733 [Chlamydomonas sp. UWO 241]|nr:hypothetical protein FOA52_006733 [Chlamydomonas sp. UWO 241]